MIAAIKRQVFSRLGRAQAMLRDLRHLPVRRAAELAIAALPDQGPPVVRGPVLVDVAYQHPNFWLRHGLLSAALGLRHLRRVALYGRFSRPALSGTLDRLGIQERLPAVAQNARIDSFRPQARRLLAEAGDADGLFRAKLPFDIPAFDLYDGLLRTQRNAVVDLGHPDCERYVAAWMAAAHESDALVRNLRPGFAILSHAQSGNDFYGVLAHALLRHGVPFVLPNGFFENLHFVHVRNESDMFGFFDAIEPDDISALPPERASRLADLGQRALHHRMTGQSTEFAGTLAFGSDKETWSRERICSTFGWDSARPIVAFLASTWFDFPHLYGNTRFRDFVEWVDVTLARAANANGINFIVRGHPVDRWYNDLFIDDVVRGLAAPNIGVLPYGIDGEGIMRASDGLITYYGSAGIEYAIKGKPVLVPDVGWYHRHAFVRFAGSREDYLDLVGRKWWMEPGKTDAERNDSMRAASIVQAMRLGYPAWQGAWRIDDDNTVARETIYARIPDKLAGNRPAVVRELETMRRWIGSGDHLYHRFKMAECDEFLHI